MSVGDVILLVMAAILPPLPVAIKRGVCSGAFFLNLLLSILAFIPGMIHAWYIILKYPEHVHTAACQTGQQRDLERNATTGTFPGQVYRPVAAPRVQGGNMDGVYGDQSTTTHKAQQQHHLLDAGGRNYGAAGDAKAQPPAYSPSDATDQGRA